MAGENIMVRIFIATLVTSIVVSPVCSDYTCRILRRMTKKVMTKKANKMLSILVNAILILIAMVFVMDIQPFGIVGEAIIVIFYSFCALEELFYLYFYAPRR